MLACRCCRRWYAAGPGRMNVFDRRTKRLQKNRAAMAPDAATYDYIRDEVCWLFAPRFLWEERMT